MGGCLPTVHAGIHPWADTPWQTPLLGKHPPGQTHPWADTLPEQTPLPLGRHPPVQADTPPRQTPPPGRHPPMGRQLLADTPPSRWLLQQTVHILLECIIVLIIKFNQVFGSLIDCVCLMNHMNTVWLVFNILMT